MNDPLADIIAERGRQDGKWGVQDHDDAAWLMILAEEVGEAAEIVLAKGERGDPYRPILKALVKVGRKAKAAIGDACELSCPQPMSDPLVHVEAVQAVAVGHAWLECMERRGWPLHVWHNGFDWVVARDQADIAKVLVEHYGSHTEPSEYEGDGWEQEPDDKLLKINYEDTDEPPGTVKERTCAEWVKENGRGFLCSTEW